MEDLATDRIYRLMIAQRVKHSEIVEIKDADGKPVRHTTELINRLFDEELERLLRELPEGSDDAVTRRLTQARELSEGMIVRGEFNPV